MALSRKRASRYELGIVLQNPWHQPAMSAYHEDLLLFNTGFELGVNEFALHRRALCIFLSHAFVVDVYTPERLWLILMCGGTIDGYWIGGNVLTAQGKSQRLS